MSLPINIIIINNYNSNVTKMTLLNKYNNRLQQGCKCSIPSYQILLSIRVTIYILDFIQKDKF